MGSKQTPHFSTKTFTYLKSLAANNNKQWFEAHRNDYEEHVREPALAYIAAMAPMLKKISPHFTALARRSGGSLMRVHRDMRFAKDGNRYKTNIGIQFRHERGRDVHAPGFYVHVEPGACFLGAGIWRPESSALAAIRMEISDRPADWKRASGPRRFTEKFAFHGDQLTRPPKGYSSDSPHLEDLRRKDFIALTNVTDAFARRTDLPAASGALFRRTAPLMRFLCAALDLEF